MIDPLSLHGVYLSAYNEIARPQRIFPVTRYFVERWVRVLKPGRAWLVVALRQTAYWNSQRDWCIVDAKTLANWVGCSEASLFNWLNAPIVSWFCWRDGDQGWRQVDGRPNKNPNRYKVLLDEPLTPGDAAHLVNWLRDRATAGTGSAVNVVQAALDTPRNELLAQGEAANVVSTSYQRAPTVLEIVQDALPEGIPTEEQDRILLAELCDRLQAHIVVPSDQLITSQYFRLNWVPAMPAGLAWLILWLRNKCWYDPKTCRYRDTTWVPSWKTVADLVGTSVKNLRRWVNEKSPSGWIQIVDKKKGRDPERPQLVAIQFQVAVRDLLTSTDEPRYHTILQQIAGKMLTPGAVERRGSGTELEARRKGSGTDLEIRREGSGTNPETRKRGSETDLEVHTQESGTNLEARKERSGTTLEARGKGSGKNLDGENQGLGTDLEGIKLIIPILLKEKSKQQQFLPDLSVAAALSIEDWLDGFGIHDPARTKILTRRPSRIMLVGWMLHAETLDWANNPAGIVVRGILNEQKLPAPFALLADLSFRQWFTFSNWPGRVGEDEQILFDAWLNVYADAPVPWELGDGGLVPHPLPQAGDVKGIQPLKQEIGRTPDEWLWARALDELKGQMTAATFDFHLHGTTIVRREGDLLVIACTTSQTREWLRVRLRSMIEHVLENVGGKPCQVQFVLSGRLPPS